MKRTDRRFARGLVRPPLSLRQGSSPWVPKRKGIPPPERTYAEHHFLLKQMSRRYKLVVVLKDGEEVHGVLEWYDEGTLKLRTADDRSIILPKHSVKYLFRLEEDRPSRAARRSSARLPVEKTPTPEETP